jgi:hypothetical protein
MKNHIAHVMMASLVAAPLVLGTAHSAAVSSPVVSSIVSVPAISFPIQAATRVDLNNDGSVNFDDLVIMLGFGGTHLGSAAFRPCVLETTHYEVGQYNSCLDFNGDGSVDNADIDIYKVKYQDAVGMLSIIKPNLQFSTTIPVGKANQGLAQFVISNSAKHPVKLDSMTFHLSKNPVPTTNTFSPVLVLAWNIQNVSLTDSQGNTIAGPVNVDTASNTVTFKGPFTLNLNGNMFGLRGLITPNAPAGATFNFEANLASDWPRGSDVSTGQAVDGTNALVKFDTMTIANNVLVGDVNGDGVVNATDLSILRSLNGQPALVNPRCDLNGNGIITIADIAMFRSMFGNL